MVIIEQVTNGYVVTVPPSSDPAKMGTQTKHFAPDLQSVLTHLQSFFTPIAAPVLTALQSQIASAAAAAPATVSGPSTAG